MNPREMLDFVKEGLSEAAWSGAVRSVRQGAVALYRKKGQRYIFDVVLGRPLPFRVEIDLEDEDWYCPCHTRSDTCVHAAAAALALYQGKKAVTAPKPSASASQGKPHLRYRFIPFERGWNLEIWLVDPAAPRPNRIVDAPPPGVVLSTADKEVLGYKFGGLSLRRVPGLLRALSLCEDVKVEERAVKVTPEAVKQILLVEDHPDGLMVRLGTRDHLYERLGGLLDLVVVGNPPTLRPLAGSSLRYDENAIYQKGRLIRGDMVAYFMSETLPGLRTRIPVEIRANKAPSLRASIPYARLALSIDGAYLDVIGTVTYGKPPQSVVVGDRIHPLANAREVPQRQPRLESSLANLITRTLGVPPGRRRSYGPFEAMRFASDVLPKFKGVVENRALAERFRIHEDPLEARWVKDARGEAELVFALREEGQGSTRSDGMSGSSGASGGFGGPVSSGEHRGFGGPVSSGEHRGFGGPGLSGGLGGAAQKGAGHGEIRLSAQEVMSAWQQGRPLISLVGGGFVRVPEQWLERYGDLLEALFDASIPLAPAIRTPILAQLFEGAAADPDVGSIKEAVLKQRELSRQVLPSGLKATLRSYQRDGLDWLVHLRKQKLGGILADDMGLGKTIQTLSLLLTDPPEEQEDGPDKKRPQASSEVVSEPRKRIQEGGKALKGQHAPNGQTPPRGQHPPNGRSASRGQHPPKGRSASRGQQAPSLVIAPTSVLDIWLAEAGRFSPDLRTRLYHGPQRSLEDLSQVDLVISSYGILRRDSILLNKIKWLYAILDEGQAIKNPDSQAAKAARALHAEHRLVLTGTPVENRLSELWSLLEFVNPGLLGNRRVFEERYSSSTGGGRALAALRVRVQPFILRRLKQDVARDLPSKTERTIKATLSPRERKIYEALRLAGRQEVHRVMAEKGAQRGRFQILEVLLRLRQACCHPGLIPGTDWNPAAASSKVRLLLEELDIILSEGHKALVFSQWTGLLDRVEPELRSANIDWLRLDGSTRNRAEVVSSFQQEDGPGVFLISLKAGGVGLNLTAADYVYHLDPWWNPAVEDQATDRAYRIGQTRPVVVSRLVAANSIEEKILNLQEKKRAIADAALGGGEDWLKTLGEEELDELLEN